MSTTDPATILFGKTRRSVLSLFFTNPGERFFLREIARRTGVSPGAIQRELSQLQAAGILEKDRHGFYAVDTASPVVSPLRDLVIRTTGVADRIRIALKPLDARIPLAFVFGSFARGDAHADSDIDLLVVSTDEMSLAEVVPVFRNVQEDLGREINPFVLSLAALRRDLRAGKPFLKRVVEQPKIWITGTNDELKRLGQERVLEAAPARQAGDRRPARRRRTRSA